MMWSLVLFVITNWLFMLALGNLGAGLTMIGVLPFNILLWIGIVFTGALSGRVKMKMR